MTAIVGVVRDQNVYIGADSAGVAGYAIQVRSDEKVFRNGNALFAFCGSFRAGQILRWKLKPPTRSRSVSLEKFLASTFVDAVRTALKEGGVAEKHDDAERHPGPFLLGIEGRLFHIHADYQVGEVVGGYTADGCGAALALGALHALWDRNLQPDDLILTALRAAAEYNAAVRPPFRVFQLPYIAPADDDQTQPGPLRVEAV